MYFISRQGATKWTKEWNKATIENRLVIYKVLGVINIHLVMYIYDSGYSPIGEKKKLNEFKKNAYST